MTDIATVTAAERDGIVQSLVKKRALMVRANMSEDEMIETIVVDTLLCAESKTFRTVVIESGERA